MNATLLASLTPADRHLVAQTEAAALAGLDEDGALDLHDRVRRARNKAVGQYRRGGAANVAAKGGRGKAKQQNQLAALRAEALEEALARVSRRVTALSRQAAADLKAERIAAARGEQATGRSSSTARTTSRADAKPAKRPTRTVAATKRRADTSGQGARRQAKRDSRGR